jgi:YfiH family protein
MLTNFITPDWDVPTDVKSLITTRVGGVSAAPYDSFNLGDHVGDNPEFVRQNRQILQEHLPSDPLWLKQTHSDKVLWVPDEPHILNGKTLAENLLLPYDASYTSQKNKVCVVMSADCIPILLTDKNASFVAAIHAGWRGVENGIIKRTISNTKSETNKHGADMLAYIGPAICKNHFEVGPDVFEKFVTLDANNSPHFTKNSNGKFNCDLIEIARFQLLKCGLLSDNIYLSNMCTYCNKEQFFSYRRDGVTGRIASLIWLS